MVFNELRTLAFRIAPDVKTLPHHFVTLSLAEDLKRHMRKELALVFNREPEKTRPRISVLNKAVRMLVPDLISITRNADEMNVRPWLYGYNEKPASPFAMQQIIRSWIYTTFPPQMSDATKSALANSVTADSLTWHKRTVDLAQWEVATNGTAKQSKVEGADRFVLLPDLMAARLCQAHIVIDWGIHRLHFRRCPIAPGNSGAELISWPPLIHEDNDKHGEKRLWPYSIVLTLSLQTVPFQPFPELHCDISVRRWAGPPITFLPGGKETSIYLLDSVPWIEGVYHSNSFQVAPVVWQHVLKGSTQKNNESEFLLTWNSDLVKLLDHLHAKGRFPDPQEIIQRPLAYLNLGSEPKPSVALVYRSGIDPTHEVGTGLMPIDRHHFAEKLKEVFTPELQFIDPPERKKFSVGVPNNPFIEKLGAEDQEDQLSQQASPTSPSLLKQRRLAIARVTNKQLILEIWYQSEIIRRALLQSLHDLLGYPAVTEDHYIWTTDELILTIHTYPLGFIGDSLKMKGGFSGKGRKVERLRDAIIKRTEEIVASLPQAEGRVAAIIELDPAETFQNEDEDPKYALRIGFAQCQRLTQFITPYKENRRLPEKLRQKEEAKIPHRASGALRDILRQCGVLGIQPQVSNKSRNTAPHIPDPLHYLGVWLIKKYPANSQTRIAQILPVIVHMASDTTEIYVKAPGFKDWLSYPDTLLALASGQGQGVHKPREAYPFIIDTLQRCIPTFPHVILFCHAQNLRTSWAWLTNDQITKELPPPFAKYKHLAIVRTRTGEHETPEWYAQNEQVPYGFAIGVFGQGAGEHVFASIQEKPPTVQKLSKESSKGMSRAMKDKQGNIKNLGPNPTVAAWNPGIVEMVVACTQTDDALMYAVIANELRHTMASHYNSPTVLPIPLHLAQLIEEYILPLEETRSLDILEEGEV